jgi:hypothetical protein
MKSKTKHLDVDFIGGQNNTLTEAELLAISAFIKADKLKNNKSINTTRTARKRFSKKYSPI